MEREEFAEIIVSRERDEKETDKWVKKSADNSEKMTGGIQQYNKDVAKQQQSFGDQIVDAFTQQGVFKDLFTKVKEEVSLIGILKSIIEGFIGSGIDWLISEHSTANQEAMDASRYWAAKLGFWKKFALDAKTWGTPAKKGYKLSGPRTHAGATDAMPCIKELSTSVGDSSAAFTSFGDAIAATGSEMSAMADGVGFAEGVVDDKVVEATQSASMMQDTAANTSAAMWRDENFDAYLESCVDIAAKMKQMGPSVREDWLVGIHQLWLSDMEIEKV